MSAFSINSASFSYFIYLFIFLLQKSNPQIVNTDYQMAVENWNLRLSRKVSFISIH